MSLSLTTKGEIFRVLAFVILFATLSYINFFIVIDFDPQKLPDNYLSLFAYDLVYMGLLTAIVVLSKPLSESNHRQLILIFLFTTLMEYLFFVRMVYAFMDYFYIAIWFNSILSFASYYLVSKREWLSVNVLNKLLNIRHCRQWALKKIDMVYLTEFDFYICRVLYIIFMANLIADALCVGYAWYLGVSWFEGSLGTAIDKGAFDLYSLTEWVVNSLILILMGYIIWRLVIANHRIDNEFKQSPIGRALTATEHQKSKNNLSVTD